MSENKRTERLFDAIGAIDDRLIQDAMSPAKARAQVAHRKKMRISLTSAACICTIVGVILLRIPKLDTDPSVGSPDPEKTGEYSTSAGQNETPSKGDLNASVSELNPPSLEQVLQYNASSQNITRLSADEIDLHDSTAKLIWQHDGDEHYNVAQITHPSSLKIITAELDRPCSDLSADCSDMISTKLWVCYGDGRVDSPYLKHTPGNTGYGVLFDYCAEVEPSSALTEAVLTIIQ